MTVARPIRVLVVDDCSLTRRSIRRMLERSPLTEVAGDAADGEEAFRRTIELRPDLVTLDLDMPRMDGFTYLRLVMERCPVPVIVVSAYAQEQELLKALDLGAVDFIAKPAGGSVLELPRMEQELLRRVHALRHLRVDPIRARMRAVPAPPAAAPPWARPPSAVVIASSTGGPSALMEILGSFLTAPPVPILVAQHMPAGFTRGLADRLSRMTAFEAREAREGDEPEPGCVLVAPGGFHMELDRLGRRTSVRLVPPSPRDRYTPSADRLFESAAKHYGGRLLAVVLTGMGDDGRQGVEAVKRAGGGVVVESQETAVIFGMPLQAIRTGVVDRVLPSREIASVIQHGLPMEPARVPPPEERP